MIMAGVGALLWLVLVPLRLRSITLLGIALAGAAPVVVWALGQDAFTQNQVPVAVREAVSTEFGLWLLATVLVMLGAGLAIGFRVARRPPRARARLRVGALATVVACVVPIVLFAVLASSDRGLGGTIKQGYESLTSISRKTPGGPARLLTASSSRGLYWHQAKEVFLAHYWKGTGAESFGVSRLQHRGPEDQSVSRHAHGYVQQTAADLGTAGLLVNLVLLCAWLVAAGRATGLLRRRGVRFAWTPERVGLIALSLVAVVFGLHSLVDWVWFVPGPTAMALVAAGFVAGRGRLAPVAESEEVVAASEPVVAPAEARVEGASHPRPPLPAAVPVGASAVATADLPPPSPGDAAGNGHPAPPVSPDAGTAVLPPLPPPPPAAPPEPPARRSRQLPPGLARSGRPLLAALTIAVAALCAWSMWQPLRADHESDRALDLSADNHIAAARAAVARAHELDPTSPRPYSVRAAVEDAAGQQPAAQKALEQAVRAFPGDPQTWLQLAQYQLYGLSKPQEALQTVGGALYLDPQSRAAQTVFFNASTALNPPPPAPLPVPVPAPAPAPTPAPVPTAPAPPAPQQPKDGKGKSGNGKTGGTAPG
jgi:hypothetical protein